MNNFIFKSSRRLIKNDSINLQQYWTFKLEAIQKELRHQRQDNKDIKLMLNKLLVDKHLQMQVDEYFNDSNTVHPEDTRDTD